MATVTLTLSDDETDEDGILFKVVFDPPIEDDDQVLTAAQSEAALILEIMQRRAMGESLKQIAEEVDDDEYGRIAGGFEPGGVGFTEPEGNN
jgi:hypothetical protein